MLLNMSLKVNFSPLSLIIAILFENFFKLKRIFYLKFLYTIFLMNNKDKYNKVFINSFSINKKILRKNISFNEIPEWDSIGHMNLIGNLEKTFSISIVSDDIMNFISYNKGIKILKKYGVNI